MFKWFVTFFLLVSPTCAQTAAPDFVLKQNIRGIDIVIPAKVLASQPSFVSPVELSVIFDLTDTFSKFDSIVRSSDVDREESCSKKFKYNGSLLNVESQGLFVKAHFNVGQQVCKKIVGIPSSATVRSNGSISMHFWPVVKDNGITLVHDQPDLQISNDIVRIVAKTLGFEARIVSDIAAALDIALNDPKASFRLPAEAVALGVTIESARFEKRGEMPVLIIAGKAPALAAPLIPFLLSGQIK